MDSEKERRNKEILRQKKQIMDNLLQFERKENVDILKFTREDLKNFFMKQYGLSLSSLQSVEGIHFCRGKLLEKSTYCDRSRLVEWVAHELPILQTSSAFKTKLKTERSHPSQGNRVGMASFVQHSQNELPILKREPSSSVDVDQLLLTAN